MLIRTAFALSALVTSAVCASPVEFHTFENADGISLDGLSFQVELIDHGSMVDLVWKNNSSAPATLVNLYVEASTFSVGALANPVIIGGSGVSYAPGSAPLNPPGSIHHWGGAWTGNLFSASPTTPRPNINAVNPGESLTMRFDLMTNFGLLTAALADPSSMRLAAHVRGVGPGSESSIWIVSDARPTTEVPAPGALGVLALAGLTAARRRR